MGPALTPGPVGTGGPQGLPDPAEETVLPPMEDRISFLVHKINARIAAITRRLFARHGLNLYSSRILVLLAERKEVRVGAMADAMVLPQSTISHQLQRLEQQGYIHRRRTDEDNRSVKVTLTALGETVAAECNALSRDVYVTMIAGLDPDEIARITGQLRRMFEAIGPLDGPP